MEKILQAIQEWHKNEDNLQSSYSNLSHFLSETGFSKHDIYDSIASFSDALFEIQKCQGRYSKDPLRHAMNTIEDMSKIAKDALEPNH